MCSYLSLNSKRTVDMTALYGIPKAIMNDWQGETFLKTNSISISSAQIMICFITAWRREPSYCNKSEKQILYASPFTELRQFSYHVPEERVTDCSAPMKKVKNENIAYDHLMCFYICNLITLMIESKLVIYPLVHFRDEKCY